MNTSNNVRYNCQNFETEKLIVFSITNSYFQRNLSPNEGFLRPSDLNK